MPRGGDDRLNDWWQVKGVEHWQIPGEVKRRRVEGVLADDVEPCGVDRVEHGPERSGNTWCWWRRRPTGHDQRDAGVRW